MEITVEMLHKIAHLARLEVKQDEEEALLSNLANVLNWMEKLQEVDTEGIEPLIHMTEAVNVWREEDVAQNTLPTEKAVSLAPDHTSRYIKVPKVIE